MSRKNIFQGKYLDLFTEHGYGINSISDIIQGLGYTILTQSSRNAKMDALDVIEQLLSYNIIYVLHWGERHKELKSKKMTVEEAIKEIRSQGVEDTESIEFYAMSTFFYTDWYMEKLNQLKIDQNTDWEWFREEVVPSIKNWVEANKKDEINVNEP